MPITRHHTKHSKYCKPQDTGYCDQLRKMHAKSITKSIAQGKIVKTFVKLKLARVLVFHTCNLCLISTRTKMVACWVSDDLSKIV